MLAAKEFSSVEELKGYLVNDALYFCGRLMFALEDIIIEPVSGNDERVGWKGCRYVCVTRFGGSRYEHPQCIGICTIDGSDPEKTY